MGFNTVYHGLPSKTVKKVGLCYLFIILGRQWYNVVNHEKPIVNRGFFT